MQQSNYLSVDAVAQRYGVNRATIWRWADKRNKRNFPQPVKLSPGCSRWKLSDVEAWEAKQGGAH